MDNNELGFETLEDTYIIARWMYSIGEAILEDSSYMTLHDAIKLSGSLPDFTERAWSSDPCPSELLDKYGMGQYKFRVTLTDKTESMPTINTWEDLERAMKNSSYPKVLSYKVDGFNTGPTYYNHKPVSMETRGRSNDALDISNYLPYLPQHIDIPNEVRLTGELALSYPAFEELKRRHPHKNLKSIRSSVRSALSENDSRELLTFIPFNVISSSEGKPMSLIDKYSFFISSGFTTPNAMPIFSYEDLLAGIKHMQEDLKAFQFPTDGIVISSWDGENHTALRVGAWAEPVYYTFIRGYVESAGPARIGVELKIEPVRLEKSTQRIINITNYRRVKALRLFPNTPVAFKLTSQAIADIDVVATMALQKMYAKNKELTAKMIAERSGWK